MKRRRFDSEDDEDEYVATAHAPLNQYANVAQDREMLLEMGIVPSSSSSSDVGGNDSPPREEGDKDLATTARANVQGKTAEERRRAKLAEGVWLSSQTRSDQDVPEELNGLLSDALLAVYQTSLLSLQSHRPVDDRLLAQYTPFPKGAVRPAGVPYTVTQMGAKADDADDVLDDEESTTNPVTGVPHRRPYKNPFGIPPGWRWDGIVRGRLHS